MGEGFFISPRGETVVVETTHMAAVIADTARFGVTQAEIAKAYERHHEPVGYDGKARVEILGRVLKNGWIRLRYKPDDDAFSVQLAGLTDQKRGFLRLFANQLLSRPGKKPYSKETRFNVLDPAGEKIETIYLGELV